jgi:hypothetical protein
MAETPFETTGPEVDVRKTVLLATIRLLTFNPLTSDVMFVQNDNNRLRGVPEE